MSLESNSKITEAVRILEKVEGSEIEMKIIKTIIRKLNALAIMSIIDQNRK